MVYSDELFFIGHQLFCQITKIGLKGPEDSGENRRLPVLPRQYENAVGGEVFYTFCQFMPHLIQFITISLLYPLDLLHICVLINNH